MTLRSEYDQKLRAAKASASAMRLADYLFSNPIITIPAAASYLKMTYPPAKSAIERLVKLDILVEQNKKQRNRTFVANEIMKILS